MTRTYTAISEQGLPPGDDVFQTLRAGHEQLINMMDQVAAGLATEPSQELIQELEALAQATAAEPAEPDEFEQQFTEDLEEIDLSLEMDELEQATEEPELTETPPLPETSEDDQAMDDELAAIFLEEARDLIDSTAEALHSWSEDTSNLDLLRLLQRDLHTLKGGARLADIPAVGDLSHELENLFEGLTEQKFSINDTLSDLLFRCHDRLAGMVEALEASEAPRPAPDLITEIHAYIDGARGTRPVTDVHTEDSAEPEDEELTLPEPELEESTEETEGAEEEELQATDLSHLDPELVGIFLEEAYDLINSTGSALHTWSEDPPSNREVAAELQRDVHTLKGGARMAGVEAIGDLTHVLEDLFEKVAEGQLEASGQMTDLLFACHDRLAQMVEQVATQKPCPPAEELVHQVQAILRGESLPWEAPPQSEPGERDVSELEELEISEQPAAESEESASSLSESLEDATDDDLVGIFLDEGLEIHEAITECLDQWREEPEELAGITRLQQELHTLKGGARLSDVDPIADLAEAWADALDQLIAGDRGGQSAMLGLSDRAAASLKSMLDALEDSRKPDADTALIDALRTTAPAEDTSGTESPQPETAEADSVDPEVLEIFLEEAGEIMDQLEQLLDDWRREPANEHFNREAQRALHTLKGGARLSQLSELGDKAHAFETRLIDLAVTRQPRSNGRPSPAITMPSSRWWRISANALNPAHRHLPPRSRRKHPNRFAKNPRRCQRPPLRSQPPRPNRFRHLRNRRNPRPRRARKPPMHREPPRKPFGYRHRCWMSWLTWPVKPVLPGGVAWSNRAVISVTPWTKWPPPSNVCGNSCGAWISKPKRRSCSGPSRSTGRTTATISIRWKWTATPPSSSCHGP